MATTNTIICPECSQINADTARICAHCGKSLQPTPIADQADNVPAITSSTPSGADADLEKSLNELQRRGIDKVFSGVGWAAYFLFFINTAVPIFGFFIMKESFIALGIIDIIWGSVLFWRGQLQPTTMVPAHDKSSWSFALFSNTSFFIVRWVMLHLMFKVILKVP